MPSDWLLQHAVLWWSQLLPKLPKLQDFIAQLEQNYRGSLSPSDLEIPGIGMTWTCCGQPWVHAVGVWSMVRNSVDTSNDSWGMYDCLLMFLLILPLIDPHFSGICWEEWLYVVILVFELPRVAPKSKVIC